MPVKILTASQAVMVRAGKAQGMTNKQLARKYQVSLPTIYRTLAPFGRNPKHELTRPPEQYFRCGGETDKYFCHACREWCDTVEDKCVKCGRIMWEAISDERLRL